MNAMDDSVQIRCTRCKSNFRERARRLQPGYSRQCPNCEVIIFFEESSADKNVQTALLAARRLRRALREAEGVAPVKRKAPTYRRSS
jgi:DNA-directed RNA polymerase subunit RPC12/RpoP